MASLRLLNEMGYSSVVLALEPANICVAKCAYCFAILNKRHQYANKQRRDEDPGTFESTCEKAFGPDYDPTNFLQYSIHNRYPLGYANTVEPFQDIAQSVGILGTLNALSIPAFIQTKGVNFDAAWPHLRPMHDNAVLFVSFPSPDDRVIKRFEPGTPKSAERWAMIEKASDAGFHVILALSPYHEEWCPDPGAFVEEAASRGAGGVFFDRLHLNRRQVEACTDPVTIRLAKEPPGSLLMDHTTAIYRACEDAGIPFHTMNATCSQAGLVNTQANLTPPGAFRRGRDWPYVDSAFLLDMEWLAFEADEAEDAPIVCTWAEALAAMESSGRIDQPFSFSSMRDLMCVKNLAPAWVRTLGKAAPARDYYRALWNSPSKYTFAWHHKFARIAMRPDGQPWRDDAANLVMIFDPSFDGPGQERAVASLDDFPSYQAGE